LAVKQSVPCRLYSTSRRCSCSTRINFVAAIRSLASYAAGPRIEVYLNHLAVGALLPEMPLFIRPHRYVNVPLESTYQDAYQGMPAFWRRVLDGPAA
jgi:hypothetical protein